jgi:hypothetical protein
MGCVILRYTICNHDLSMIVAKHLTLDQASGGASPVKRPEVVAAIPRAHNL